MIRMTAAPVSACASSSTSRICACTVTSRAVVGSSAMITRRVVGDRHRDHHPLAHPAGELVRERPRPGRGFGMPTRSSSSTARFPAAPRPMFWWICSASTICRPTVKIGVSEDERVLEDHADAPGRGSPNLPVVEAEQLALAEQDRAGDRGVVGQQTHDRHRGDRLARARLADDAQRAARVQVEVDARGRPRTRPASEGKDTCRSRTDSTGPAGGRARSVMPTRPPDRDVGSSASRSPSPISAIEHGQQREQPGREVEQPRRAGHRARRRRRASCPARRRAAAPRTR